jgi:hypothetical protein
MKNEIFNKLLRNIATPIGEHIFPFSSIEYKKAISFARCEIKKLKDEYNNHCAKCIHYKIIEEYSREYDENGDVMTYKVQDVSGICKKCSEILPSNFKEKK